MDKGFTFALPARKRKGTVRVLKFTEKLWKK
jgi:hypothetical protein